MNISANLFKYTITFGTYNIKYVCINTLQIYYKNITDKLQIHYKYTTKILQININHKFFKMTKRNNIALSKKDLEKLRNCLPIEFAETTALKMELTVGYIHRVMAGTSRNDKIIYLAVESAENYKIDLENISKKIQAL